MDTGLCCYTVLGGEPQWGWAYDGRAYRLSAEDVRRALSGQEPRGLVWLMETAGPVSSNLNGANVELVAPLAEGMEVWAAGVTYESSKLARMAESEGGEDFYARVYAADRPELFFKATPGRTVGPDAAVRIRQDSAWNVPEPELATLIAANGQILGYTIGNDMSSRDIEGANPLYLPQAKVYTGSCALGPWIVPAESIDPARLPISLTISRKGKPVFSGETSTARMRRTPQELASWLFRENTFPSGVVLLTGTGIIPPDDFTLKPGDQIQIEIGGIGTLENTVEKE